MLRRPLILDGLWYTLCPSFNRLAITRPALASRPKKQSSRLHSAPAIYSTATPSRRCYSSDTSSSRESSNTESDAAANSSRNGPPSDVEPQISPDQHKHLDDSWHTSRSKHETELWAPEIRTRTIRVYKDLLEQPISYLEGRLQRDDITNIYATTQVLRALIRDHHVKPSARHYRALILAHRDSQRGSPDAVRGLLEEMEEDGITADSGTLHAILQVLAVHPDYLFRQEVLQKLRERWLTLSPAGWHFVVAGLLREHQFEIALEQVAMMERKDIPVENWLHSMMIYHFCDFQEFDEVYRLMRARVEQGHDITHALWQHVLNTAADAGHFPTVRYVWHRRVELGYLHPSADTCSKVLEYAARAGDAEQANSVFRYHDNNNMAHSSQDYEQLIKANMATGSLSTVFELLCAMHEDGFTVTEIAIEPIIAHMIQHQTDPRAAWQMLKQLKNVKRSIPLGAVRVITELCERKASDDPLVVDDALGFYKELYTLCPDGADLQVFNTLIRMCRNAKNREAAMFLVKEMASFGVIPDAVTFETLIMMCLEAGNYRSAYMYFRDLIKRDLTFSPDTKAEIRRKCRESVDEFAMRLQFHPLLQRNPLVQVAPEGQEISPAEWVALSRRERTKAFEANPRGTARTDLVYKARLAYNRERRRRKRQRQALGQSVEENGRPEEEEGLDVEENPDYDEPDMDSAKPSG